MKKAKVKKSATKAKARKTAKPGARKSAKPAEKTGSGTYTPQPIQGIGWAPFRYPLQ